MKRGQEIDCRILTLTIWVDSKKYHEFVNMQLFYPLQPDDVQSRGVGHGDEMAFLFSTSQKFSLRHIAHLSSQKDLATSAKMIRMWLNFVHTYNPTPNPGKDQEAYDNRSFIFYAPSNDSTFYWWDIETYFGKY